MEGKQGAALREDLCRIITGSKGSVEMTSKWINPEPLLQESTLKLFPEACVNHRIFERRSGKRPTSTVTIRSVQGTEYEHIRDTQNLSIYVGGPGSMIGAALDSVLSNKQSKNSHVLFVTSNFEHSNARSSAYYFHVRHSNSLDADRLVRGHRVLKEFIYRQLISRKMLLLRACGVDYLKVDISVDGMLSSPTHCFKTVFILVRALWHTARNVIIEKINPSQTDWACNRGYSQKSAPVLKFLENSGEQLGVKLQEGGNRPTLLIGTESDCKTPEAIHVVFNERGAKHTEDENAALLKSNNIRSRELSRMELDELMSGNTGEIHKAYLYPGDGRLAADMNLVLREIVEKSGNSWKEGVAVESIYVDEGHVRGIGLRNLVTNEQWYQPCSSVVLSLGYTAQYKFEPNPTNTASSISARIRQALNSIRSKLYLLNPVPRTTVAAGCSGYFLVKGRIPIIGAQNSHWTEVDYSPEADITLAKLTGGGNIGSEHIPATYPLNNLEYLKKMFGDRFIDVLSVESCPRAINHQNDVQFYNLVPGVVVSLGLGGTGMTKCGANGALSYLLAHPEVSELDSVDLVASGGLFDSVDLSKIVNERSVSIQRALGHRNDLSLIEYASLVGLAFLGIYYIARVFSSQLNAPHPYDSPTSSIYHTTPVLDSRSSKSFSFHSSNPSSFAGNNLFRTTSWLPVAPTFSSRHLQTHQPFLKAFPATSSYTQGHSYASSSYSISSPLCSASETVHTTLVKSNFAFSSWLNRPRCNLRLLNSFKTFLCRIRL